MNNIKILDCTLRDGGYINDWNFGLQNIMSILTRLEKANVDIIECGFLEDGEYNQDLSMFTNVDQIESILPARNESTQYVAMTRYGFLNIDHLNPYDGKSINGIRVTFHEDEVLEAIEFCKQIQAKGYRTYVQPVGTTSYSDKYLLNLIDLVNDIKPYAFYIVDTLGLMRKSDLLRMFYLVDHNLNSDIVIGYHSHNNLQLAFSNAQELADVHTKRQIIIDSSVYGMGRGAGNLNTELITQHLNSLKDRSYNTDYLLEIVDETIGPLLEKYTWGYSVPYYLAAINNCHPNYASYLMNRKTLPVKSISKILNHITNDKRELYSESYVQELYTQYQKHQIDDSKSIENLKTIFMNKEILIVAPGSSVKGAKSRIKQFQDSTGAVIITVNFEGDGIDPDFCFFSNDKRYQKFSGLKSNESSKQLILSSNIQEDIYPDSLLVNYSDLINAQPLVNDNATLMLLTLLIKLGVNKVSIAGFDGFHSNSNDNYADQNLETDLDNEIKMMMNAQIKEEILKYSQVLEFEFMTESLFNPMNTEVLI
ncbi:aldolase catalytic domain-containing protein [Paenibacillus sp. HB172176]|uniref:aldolase catalytic domain-containing protein n=1 Tax=Paenibacillus sp. HB172176 TaxID=2493690 RepID=UPI00143CA3E8|nr:aldolase catalytic domain-containing protein [Paenibacillus sp. HB172176]